jgi:sialate O-acetylesterase
MKKIALPFLFFLLVSFYAFAEIRLPAILGDHMVLQQNSTVKLWGWSEVREAITIKTTWDTTTYKTTGNGSAKWSIQIKTPSGGGPYKITITGRNTVVIDDVLIGEVWLLSGQSNMEMSASWPGMQKYNADVASATNKNIRFFHVPKTTALYPQDDLKAKWVVCNPEDMKRFSIAGYFFGQKLNTELNSPVGLINSSWSGSAAEPWTPANEVAQNPILAAIEKETQGRLNTAQMFNAMIYPITNFEIAGTLWYQGESNVRRYATYKELFTTMISSWRKAWGKEFPFYFAQIAPYSGYGKTDTAAYLREQQTKTLSLKNTGMVVTSDIVDNINDIHPQMKKEVGLRFANLALAETYKKNITGYKSPLYQSMKIEKDKIRISFENAEKGLVSKNGAPTEFYIAGEDRRFVPATAKIDGNTVVVWNKEIKNPVAVRFGFSNAAMPNLFSKEGLPVNIFRTDDWEVHVERVAMK